MRRGAGSLTSRQRLWINRCDRPESARKAAGVQKGLFLRRGGAAEHGVTVRKASEAPDDVRVNLGISVGLAAVGLTRQGQGSLLVSEIFGMLERQIEKGALGGGDACVEAPRNGAMRDRAGERVGRES